MNKSRMNRNKSRDLSRRKQVSHVVNRSANEALNLTEFMWMVTDRMKEADLPDSWKTVFSQRKVMAELWQRFKEEGICLSPHRLPRFRCGRMEIPVGMTGYLDVSFTSLTMK